MFDEQMDRLTQVFTGEQFKEEVATAKRDFFDEAGVVDEESQTFEMRMTQFLEWYLFARPLEMFGQTPAAYALQMPEFSMTSAERPIFENLANTRHSLFEFVKIRGNDIYIRDLISGKKTAILDSPIRIGFSRDEIFDARLIPDGDKFHFARAFCFHPAEAGTYILSEIKKLKKVGNSTEEVEKLILRFLKMRYKYEHYRHLKLEYVYTNEKKVRF